MYQCPNCGFTTNDSANFCVQCGAPMHTVEIAPTPAHTPLGEKIAGMAVAIVGFSFSCIMALYSLPFMFTEPIAMWVFFFMFGVFSAPPAIIGLVMSSKARANGDTSAFSRVGIALGRAAIIIMAACFTLAVVVSFASGFYYY